MQKYIQYYKVWQTIAAPDENESLQILWWDNRISLQSDIERKCPVQESLYR